MTSDAGHQVVLKPGAVSWREADGEVIALDLRTSEYLGVNATGKVLWTKLAEGSTQAGLAAALVDAFGIDQARADADVATFLDDARARDLLA